MLLLEFGSQVKVLERSGSSPHYLLGHKIMAVGTAGKRTRSIRATGSGSAALLCGGKQCLCVGKPFRGQLVATYGRRLNAGLHCPKVACHIKGED